MTGRLSIIIAILGILILPGCHRNKTSGPGKKGTDLTIHINGSLEGGAGKQVILEQMGAREFIPEDTVTCDISGSFKISCICKEEAFYILRYGAGGYVTLLLKPGERIDFKGTSGRTDLYEVAGSPGSELLCDLALEHKRTLNSMGDISRKNMELVSSPDYVKLKAELDRQFDSIAGSFYNYSLDFIYRNPASLSILIALYNLYGQGLPVFQPERDFHVYQFVDSALMSSHSGFEAVRLLHAEVEEAKQIINNDNQVRPLQRGEIAPDFVSSRPDGTELALSDLKGNYVLLSFWAGWSRLSRDENRTLKAAYKKYKQQPFRILQVSLDDDMDVWTEAIREDELKWDHVSDLMRWESLVVDMYRVEKIPSNVLIDPEGRIVETDLLGDRLLEKLDSIFNN